MDPEVFRATLQEQWPLARAHARYSESEAELWPCTGWDTVNNGPRAAWFKPYQDIDDERFLSREQKLEAQSQKHYAKHRVAIFEDCPVYPEGVAPAVVGALLRHELEHARQFDACGEVVFDIDDQFLDHAQQVLVGGVPGGAVFYNLKPMEMDANAAAAQFLRDHHPDAISAILASESAQLARPLQPPESTDTLLTRTVACLYLFRDICERASGDLAFWNRLAVYDKRASDLWRLLDDHDGHAAGAVSPYMS